MRISASKLLRLVALVLFMLIALALFERQLYPKDTKDPPPPIMIASNEQLQERQKNEIQRKAFVEPTYEEPTLPPFWLSRDFTGLSKEEFDRSNDHERGAASHRNYAFNAYKSNKISLRRKLSDFRSQECVNKEYLSDLPQASVIICFVDEVWSALFRTVWSVLDRSDTRFLKEIILVNDASEVDWLREDLHAYMSKLPKIVRLVESKERLGLIRARTFGADHATGDVLVFLDSHCEATQGWLEPIIDRIGRDHNTVVCPAIDAISDSSLDFHHGGGTAVGSFHWTLDFTWITPHLKPGTSPSDPLPSATMAGGLFAIHRVFWERIGKYDLSMQGWGGENLEISFRIWQCGGRLEILPCSHVGHIFRSSHPYNVPGGFGNAFMRNSARVAEVWLDEYKDVYYHIRPEAKKQNIGDVSERLALREKLGCKSFKWYLDTLLPGKFVPTRDLVSHEGHMMNLGINQCIDLMGHSHAGESLGLYSCHGAATASTNQAFYMTTTGQIRTTWDKCFGFMSPPGEKSTRHPVVLQECVTTNTWRYDSMTLSLVHANKNMCLEASPANSPNVFVAPCDPSLSSQKWKWSGSLNA